MEQRNKEQRTAQILYITIIMALLIMAIAVGFVTSANKKSAPKITETAFEETSAVPQTTSATTERKIVYTKATEIETAKPPETSSKPVINIEEPSNTVPDFILPTIGNISKTFSIEALVYSNTMEDYRTHNGIDICAALGDAVMAAADGTVADVYVHPMMGNTVVIKHDGDSETVYQNLADDITVEAGSKVSAGEVIGAIGESAIIEIAEEPHLHFEISVAGNLVNPVDYISETTMTVIYQE